MIKVELILLESEAEYRGIYKEEFVGKEFLLGDIPVFFDEKSFDHIFFENGPGGIYKQDFSFRRAKRMLFIKEILSGTLNTEIMFESEKGTIALFCPDLECVLYLRIKKINELQVGTIFDFGKDHTKMYEKQKKKCVPITLPEIKDKLTQMGRSW